ncbi:MAG: hypothetical protein GKR97_02765 [Rhizobiaceae bacterium]|nr:hypothetical protein [Rhizobiaceae bacterium]
MMPPIDLNLMSHTPARYQIPNQHGVDGGIPRVSPAATFRKQVRALASRLRSVVSASKVAGNQQGLETEVALR